MKSQNLELRIQKLEVKKLTGCILYFVFCILLLNTGCFKKKFAGNVQKENETTQVEKQKFAYVFERRNRRNPYIGVGILPENIKTPQKTYDKKEVVKTPQEDKKAGGISGSTIQKTINRWPADEETIKILRETYGKLDEVCGRVYEDIMDSLERFDEISDEDFVKTFADIYILYKFYYQSKRGNNLKKYTNTLKLLIDSIEKTFNPVRFIYEYLEETFSTFRSDFVKAQSKPSLFEELKDDLEYVNQLLRSPLLTIRKKKFIPYIEKINGEMAKNYRELNKKLNLYLSLYEDFKKSNVHISGYIYSKGEGRGNVLFVGDEVKRVGDVLWGDVEILGIGKGEMDVLYKGEKLILHFWEE